MELHELDALLDGAKRAETIVPLCLRGDLQAEHEELELQLSELRKAKQTDAPGGVDLAERIQELEQRMAASTVQFRLRGMPRRDWKKLKEQYPARKDNDVDKFYGFNLDTLFDAAIPACLVEPEVSAERLANLLDEVTSGQFERLSMAVLELNQKALAVPFSQAASRITQKPGEMSRRPSDSASAGSGS
jgi:hypothetical protein